MPEVAERYQAPALVRRLLELRTIAVVGLSANPARPSHGVGVYLMNAGYTVIPVNPKASEVLGQRAYPSLLEVPGKVDLVDVFRASDAVPEIAEQAVAIGARGLWLQLGVINSRGIEIAEAGGLDVVVDLCIKIEHARYAA
jgi:predicted CoA-binding protein